LLKNGGSALMKASSSIQEMRTKYFEEMNKIQENTRREMKKIQEENTKLKIEISNHRR
jgi:hypothetical protein